MDEGMSIILQVLAVLLSCRQNERGHRQYERKSKTNQRVKSFVSLRHKNKTGLGTKDGTERQREKDKSESGRTRGELKQVKA